VPLNFRPEERSRVQSHTRRPVAREQKSVATPCMVKRAPICGMRAGHSLSTSLGTERPSPVLPFPSRRARRARRLMRPWNGNSSRAVSPSLPARHFTLIISPWPANGSDGGWGALQRHHLLVRRPSRGFVGSGTLVCATAITRSGSWANWQRRDASRCLTIVKVVWVVSNRLAKSLWLDAVAGSGTRPFVSAHAMGLRCGAN